LTGTAAIGLIALFVNLKTNGKNKLARFSLMCGILLSALAWGTWYWQGIDSLCTNALETEPFELTCRVLSDPQQGSISYQSLVETSLPTGKHCRLRLYWPKQDELPAYGAEVRIIGSYKPLTDHQETLYQQGVVGTVAVKTVRQTHFPNDILGRVASFRQTNQQLLTADDNASGLLLAGVLLGDSSRLNTTWTGETYRITGLAHLIAVSGSHLAVIASLVGWILQRLGLSSRSEVVLLVLFIVLYVVLTAMQPSALRSAGMMAIIQGSRLIGRRAHAPSALSVTACLMIIVQPPTAFSLGFWLSVFAVFGLAVFLPLIKAWVIALPQLARHSKTQAKTKANPVVNKATKKLARLVKRQITEPLALSLTAQASTIPLTAPAFACVSLVALPANLVVTPLIVLILSLGMPALVIGWLLPPVLKPALLVLHAIANLSCWLAESMARLPWASIPIDADQIVCLLVAGCIAALIYRLWPKPSRSAWLVLLKASLCALLLLITAFLRPTPPEIIMLDIGQGDAIVIRDSSNCVLIDTGPSVLDLRRALSRNQVNHLDAVIISHLDSDHCGGLRALNGTVLPDTIYFADGLKTALPEAMAITNASTLIGMSSVQGLKAGDVLVVSRHLQLTVLLPRYPALTGGNDDSLVLCLDYDADNDGFPEASVLLTGDAETEILMEIINLYPNRHFDVLKVAHHGSRKSVNDTVLQAWACRLALISVGSGNHFGHPTNDALAILSDAGVDVLRTDLSGDIRLRFSASGITISYSNTDPFWSF
jgi:competence protein ComEC